MSEIVFLDRDGVINHFPGKGQYLVRREDFKFLPGALEAISLLTKAGKEIYVVSNQGCVSRGMISLEELNQMTSEMLSEISRAGGKIQKVYYCVHQKSDGCDCKKPKIKLFLEAIGGRKMDLEKVFFIGDSEEDIQAGKNLGCRTILALSGRTTEADLPQFPFKPDEIKKNLLEAAQWILKKKS